MDLKEKILFIYHSNQLAEITLSVDQTRQIAEDNHSSLSEEMLAPDGVSFESASVSSHLNALNYVLSFPSHKKIDLAIIKGLHARLMEGLILSKGEFRECNVRIQGIQPYPFQKIEANLSQLLNIVDSAFASPPEDKEQFAWKVHHEFSLVHPFVDGNGRMSRLFYNMIRTKFGLPANIIKSDEKSYYLKSIQDYQKYKIRQAQKLQ